MLEQNKYVQKEEREKPVAFVELTSVGLFF